jgi:uncharacterized protein YndB with AHSA1/START domain
MGATKIRTKIRAPRDKVYRALLDPDLVAQWKVPREMTCEIHEWNPVVGGIFRVSLTYLDDSAGKSSAHTDTYHGRFTKLEENVEVRDEIEFETEDPAMQGLMTSVIGLSDLDDGTELIATHRNLPPGLSPELNMIGWRESLFRLKIMLEAPRKLG